MDTTLAALCYRTWAALRSGMLAALAPELTQKAQAPFEEFSLYLAAQPAMAAWRQNKLDVYSNEYFIHLPTAELTAEDCIITNRKIVIFGEADHPQKLLVSRIVRQKVSYSARRDVTRIKLKLKNGSTATLRLRGDKVGSAIELALSDLQAPVSAGSTDKGFGVALESALGNPEFEAIFQPVTETPELSSTGAMASGQPQEKPDHAPGSEPSGSVKPRTTSTSDEPEEESVLAEFRPWVLGFLAFAGYLLASGAPLFEGGPTVIRWLSVDGNMIHFYVGAVLGIAAPWVWPGTRKE